MARSGITIVDVRTKFCLQMSTACWILVGIKTKSCDRHSLSVRPQRSMSRTLGCKFSARMHERILNRRIYGLMDALGRTRACSATNIKLIPTTTSNGRFHASVSAGKLKGPIKPNGGGMHHGQNSVVYKIPTTGNIHNVFFLFWWLVIGIIYYILEILS